MSNTPDVPSAIKPIHHGPDFPVPAPDCNMVYNSDSEHSVIARGDTYKPVEKNQPVLLTQADLNDLPRNLNLSKLSVFTSQRETSVSIRNTIYSERELKQFLTFQDKRTPFSREAKTGVKICG